jgi:hypothetical protein
MTGFGNSLSSMRASSVRFLYNATRVAHDPFSLPVQAFCFALVAGVYLLHLFLSGYDRFYYDAEGFWQLGKGGHFGYPWRGYSIPLLTFILHHAASVVAVGDVTIVKIWGAVLAATFGVVILPRLSRVLFPKATIGIGRILAVNALIFLYWRDHFNFPLVDFPAMVAASIGVIGLLRVTTWGYVIAGLSLGLAVNLRGNYAPALLAAVVVAGALPLRPRCLRRRALAVTVVLIGALAVSSPQILINYRQHGSWSPGIPTAHDFTLILFWIGMNSQKYETYVGPRDGYPLPGVYYVDPATRRLLDEEGISAVMVPGPGQGRDPAFPGIRRYVRLVFDQPIEMAASYVRHIFNGLDVKYPTPYVRNLGNRSLILSLLQYTLIFMAAARLLIPSARRALGRVRWLGIAVLLGACLAVLPTSAEPRYYLPMQALVYMLTCFGTATRASFLGGSTSRRAALGVSYVGFLLICVTLSSTTLALREY